MKKLDISGEIATATIPELLQKQAEKCGDRPYAHFPDKTLTYAQLHAQATDWAAAFHAAGIRPGDHVATLMPNCWEWVPVYYGALYAGAILVALNSRYKRHELAYTLAHSRSKILVTTEAFAEHVDYRELLADVLPDLSGQTAMQLNVKAAPDMNSIVMFGKSTGGAIANHEEFLALGTSVQPEALQSARDTRNVDDTAAIIYTSGTTSNPKGCELTHGGLQNCWSTFSRVIGLDETQSMWLPMPFFHTGGIGPMTTILEHGASFITQPHFDAEEIVEMIERYEVNHLYSGFPQLTLPVLESPRFDRERFTFVKSCLNVGPEATQRRIDSLLPDGALLLNLFGMTEGSGIVTFTPADAPLSLRIKSSGLPPPHTDVRIADPETLEPCEDGTVGEIQFRGAGAFKKYYRNHEATAETIIEGGWVRTGDRGKVGEDGTLYFLGRIKDMLKVGGENVGALEIESFLQEFPEIRLAQVIGVPDERMGEVPVAFVELMDDDAVLDESQLIARCEGQLAKWKIPRRAIFVKEWPMSATKVQKFRLRDLL
ncbi:class I adenylate-forming enzyme family protein [Parasphingorhabdus sp.]|uniref:class I adenylate-forming enzyme family protein n=1 Tax=Parasphingorhabdus sp. TaxID=2709688 RepID=UPI002F957F70